MLSCMSCLYILDINPLSFGHIICKYFLPFSRLSFCFVDSFLGCQKLLSLIRSHLFIFAFIYFRRQIQKNIAMIYVQECSANVFL